MRTVSCIYVVVVLAVLVLAQDLRASDPLYNAVSNICCNTTGYPFS